MTSPRDEKGEPVTGSQGSSTFKGQAQEAKPARNGKDVTREAGEAKMREAVKVQGE